MFNTNTWNKKNEVRIEFTFDDMYEDRMLWIKQNEINSYYSKSYMYLFKCILECMNESRFSKYKVASNELNLKYADDAYINIICVNENDIYYLTVYAKFNEFVEKIDISSPIFYMNIVDQIHSLVECALTSYDVDFYNKEFYDKGE